MTHSKRFLKHRSSGDTGFTLLEILVCLAILAIAFIAVLKSTLQVQDSLAQSRFRNRASQLGAEKIAEIRLQGPDAIGAWQGEFEEHPQYRWSIDVRPTSADRLQRVVLHVFRADDEEKRLSFEEFHLETGSR